MITLKETTVIVSGIVHIADLEDVLRGSDYIRRKPLTPAIKFNDDLLNLAKFLERTMGETGRFGKVGDPAWIRRAAGILTLVEDPNSKHGFNVRCAEIENRLREGHLPSCNAVSDHAKFIETFIRSRLRTSSSVKLADNPVLEFRKFKTKLKKLRAYEIRQLYLGYTHSYGDKSSEESLLPTPRDHTKTESIVGAADALIANFTDRLIVITGIMSRSYEEYQSGLGSIETYVAKLLSSDGLTLETPTAEDMDSLTTEEIKVLYSLLRQDVPDPDATNIQLVIESVMEEQGLKYFKIDGSSKVFKTLDQELSVDDAVLVPKGEHGCVSGEVTEVGTYEELGLTIDYADARWMLSRVSLTKWKETMDYENELLRLLKRAKGRAAVQAAKDAFLKEHGSSAVLPALEILGGGE